LFNFCLVLSEFSIHEDLRTNTFFCALLSYFILSLNKQIDILKAKEVQVLEKSFNLNLSNVNKENIKEFLTTMITVKYLKDEKLKYNAQQMLEILNNEDF
jgi:hypothetical protein